MKIVIGNDHAAVQLKNVVKNLILKVINASKYEKVKRFISKVNPKNPKT